MVPGDVVNLKLTVNRVTDFGNGQFAVSFNELPSVMFPNEVVEASQVSEDLPAESAAADSTNAGVPAVSKETWKYILHMDADKMVQAFELNPEAVRSYSNFVDALDSIVSRDANEVERIVEECKKVPAIVGDVVRFPSGEDGIVVNARENLYFVWSPAIDNGPGEVSIHTVAEQSEVCNMSQHIAIGNLLTRLSANVVKSSGLEVEDVEEID